MRFYFGFKVSKKSFRGVKVQRNKGAEFFCWTNLIAQRRKGAKFLVHADLKRFKLIYAKHFKSA